MQLQTNGITTHYDLEGLAHAPVIMCCHSLATDLHMWWPQLEAFIGEFQVLRYDVRGHGASDAPDGPYSLDQLAEDARALLDGLGIDRVHWVGISMGGMIGQAFALKYPQRLHSLSICDSMARFPADAREAWEERLQLARTEGLGALVEPTLDRWFSPGFATANADIIARIEQMIRHTPVAGYLGCSHAIMQLDLLGRLGAIRTPSLVLVGEQDPGTPVAAARAIHQAIPGSRLRVIPGARHLTSIETADEFNEAVLDLVQATYGAPSFDTP